jgi:hypothetical protein
MNEGALNLTDCVLPDVPLRQFVLTMPFPLRFPLAFDGKLLGQVVRIFADTVAGWYRRRHADRGLPEGQTGAVTVIQRAPPTTRASPRTPQSISLGPNFCAVHSGSKFSALSASPTSA